MKWLKVLNPLANRPRAFIKHFRGSRSVFNSIKYIVTNRFRDEELNTVSMSYFPDNLISQRWILNKGKIR